MRKKNWKRKPKSARERFMDRLAAQLIKERPRLRGEYRRWEELLRNNPDLLNKLPSRPL